MGEARNRVDNPSPEVIFQEILLPNDQDFGTGVFRLRVKENTLVAPGEPGPKAISALALNAPHFQVAISINPGTKEIPVLLGRGAGSDPSDIAVFVLPPKLDTTRIHDFEATFQDWRVMSLAMDGNPLPRSPAVPPPPPSVAGMIRAKQGERISIPPLGPQSPKKFTAEEQKRVVTVIDFELPFALEGLEGRLPVEIVLDKDVPGEVGIRTRQKHAHEISRSLGLAHVLSPTSGVIVATGDPHGRLNISALQFQFRGFQDLTNRGQLFKECLDIANHLIERYRMAKHEFRLRKVANADILFYGARHLLDGQVYNDYYDPVAPVTLVSSSQFPCDGFLWDALRFRYARTAELWERLVAEARHYLAVGDNRLAVATSFTALEVVIKEHHWKNMKSLLARGGLEYDRLHFRDTKDSVSNSLGLLNIHSTHLRLDTGLTERVIKHYELRNAIMHAGTMRVGEGRARQCVDDTYLLLRHLLEILHLSVIAQFEIISLPRSDTAFPLMRVETPEWAVASVCPKKRVWAGCFGQTGPAGG